MRKPRAQQRGFTVVELLIATLVFSVVLMIVTAGIIQVTRVYYKGVTEANTQSVARSISDVVGQAIQFSPGTVTPTPAVVIPGAQSYFCVGGTVYLYYQGYELIDVGANPAKHQTSHSIVAQPFAGGCAGSGFVNGRDLMSPKMRLSKVTVKNVGSDPNTYQVEVRVVYGDDDVLSNPTGANAACASVHAGTQFCAVSDLTTVVVKRVQ
ncbi:MAG TPA: prepilin-type N-terminal cleavage/methylation domain-containing protein [Patescibacteria group bacterium]|nr:prepilin-type N-terminal cleavage/methylation domain-containing protein [Patescibacteria group bacterium]